MDIRRFPDSAALSTSAAAFLAERIAAVIAKQGCCHLALAGGSTPARTYEALRMQTVDWPKLHIWFGDERCLPAGDPERNDRMAFQTLLHHVPIPAQQIHAMQAELGATRAAKKYSGELAKISQLDIVVLGIGEDGHTASLFPNNAALKLHEAAVPVFDAPKPPPQRISLSLDSINQAAERIVLVAGASKRAAMQQIMRGDALPAGMIHAATWLTDLAAAGNES